MSFSFVTVNCVKENKQSSQILFTYFTTFLLYNPLATYVHTALRTVLSFLWVCFGLFGLYSSCLPFCLKRGNKCTEKQTGCVAIANPKSKRQSKTNIHTKMKYVFWRVGYIQFLLYRWKPISCLDLEIYSWLVFVSCMNIWLWEIS